ncbi:MAG: hypothetical protein ABIT37_02655 [Luteolibacter sp.]
MKAFSLAILIPVLAIPGAAEEASWLLPGNLVGKDGAVQRIWLVSATPASIRYRASQNLPEVSEHRISETTAVCLDEPPELAAAMNLYHSRKYAEARTQFIEMRQRFKPLVDLKNNPSTLAAFYETECLRKSGDLDGLAAALVGFSKGPLTRETELRQLELDEIWEAVRVKNWERVETLAKEREKTRLPGDQRAQVAYCQGFALEALKRPEEALFSYDTALTADAGASEEIARQAALRILAIHYADEQVMEAIRLRGTKDEDKTSAGSTKLAEAAAVARLFQLSFGAGAPLPAEFVEFLKEIWEH